MLRDITCRDRLNQGLIIGHIVHLKETKQVRSVLLIVYY